MLNRETLKDNAIGEAYSAAKSMAPDAQQIKLSSTVEKLRQLAPQNELTGGLLKAVKGTLEQRGIIKGKGLKLVGRIDASTAEDIRKTLNSFYDGANPQARMAIRSLKESIDDDVMRSVGSDVFADARQAKAEFEKNLNRAKVSKFDSRRANIVRDIMENKINPDNFVQDAILAKKWRAEDLKQLKDFTIGDGEGLKSWNDTRAEVLQYIKDNAFSGPVDENGFQAITRTGLQKSFDKIGTPKMKVIFNSDELRFFKDLLDVTKLREPGRFTALGRGPSAQAIGRVESAIKENPIAGALIGLVDFDSAGKAAIKSSPDVIISPSRLDAMKRQSIAATSGLGVAAAANAEEDEQEANN